MKELLLRDGEGFKGGICRWKPGMVLMWVQARRRKTSPSKRVRAVRLVHWGSAIQRWGSPAQVNSNCSERAWAWESDARMPTWRCI